jgi:hypothetical protein
MVSGGSRTKRIDGSKASCVFCRDGERAGLFSMRVERQLRQFWNNVAAGALAAGFSVPYGQRLTLGLGARKCISGDKIGLTFHQ